MKRSVGIVIGFLVVALIGCDNPLGSEGEDRDENGVPKQQARSVSFVPAGGTYNEDISVTLSTQTEGVTIYYTTDGSDPDSDSQQYTDPIEVAGHETETTIKAIAVADGYTDSTIAEASYEIDYSVEQPDLEGDHQPDYRTMIRVPGGTFAQQEYDGFFGRSFEHTISGFDMARYEVTYELWYTVRDWAEENGYVFNYAGTQGGPGSTGVEPGERSHEPVVELNWYDMVVWANAYSEMAGLEPVYYLDSGYTELATDATAETDFSNDWVDWDADGYRLPTEGEWQYVARWRGTDTQGTDGQDLQEELSDFAYEQDDGALWYFTPPNWLSGANHAWNEDTSSDEGWFAVNSTKPVGRKEANQLGIYDMSGNAYEWTWDWRVPYPNGPETDYRGPASGSSRVLLGGSWRQNSARALSVGWREDTPPQEGDFFSHLGFRVVRTR